MAKSTKIDNTKIDYSKLVGFSGKQMLVVSLDKSFDDLILKIETEPHFWLRNRIFLTHTEISSLCSKKVLNEYLLCTDIGFDVLIKLLARVSDYSLSLLLSIHDYPGTWVVRFDEEKKIQKNNRQFIKQIPLPTSDIDELLKNERLCYAVGKTALEILLSYEDVNKA